MTQRPEGEDCLATQPIDGLETIPNCVSDLHGTRGASAIAASPDGEHVYVAGSLTADPLATPDPASHNVAVLRRADNGALTQASGTEACVSREASVGCAEDAMLGRPSDLAMSPDGRHVYVASNDSGTSSILTYSRDAVTGALTRTSCVSGAAPCLVDQVRALDDVRAIALSPDGNARSAAS